MGLYNAILLDLAVHTNLSFNCSFKPEACHSCKHLNFPFPSHFILPSTPFTCKLVCAMYSKAPGGKLVSFLLPKLSRNDGIWYPDQVSPSMVWSGSGSPADSAQHLPGGPINPFLHMPDSALMLTFTESLPSADKEPARQLQWALPTPSSMDGVSPDRGNLALAKQDWKPSWLSKPALCSFGRWGSGWTFWSVFDAPVTSLGKALRLLGN